MKEGDEGTEKKRNKGLGESKERMRRRRRKEGGGRGYREEKK